VSSVTYIETWAMLTITYFFIIVMV